ncbi:MAG: 50S ribosomal protein L11 methyltransferase [Legionella sp.]
MLQLEIKDCHPNDAELMVSILERAGTLSLTMTDAFDDAILEPELGTYPLWPHVVIHALFADHDKANLAKLIIQEKYPAHGCILQELPEQDWERVCMADFKPLQFGNRLWICPSWLTPPDPKAINLTLDPGLAFGTGTHETTSLCLEWLAQHSIEQLEVIDYGCGSGILALAAIKLGARYVHAIDIDRQALEATVNNAKMNQISSQQLSTHTPEQIDSCVDLIIANILLTPLLQLKQRFAQLLNENGTLIVSGVITEQTVQLIDSYHDSFCHIETTIDGNWALLMFVKKPEGN